jgi:hypothetical protein
VGHDRSRFARFPASAGAILSAFADLTIAVAGLDRVRSRCILTVP